MKKHFLAVLLAVLMAPALFSLGLEFDFFTGTGISTGLVFGQGNLHSGLGFIYDGHKSDIKAKVTTYSSSSYYNNYSTRTVTAEKDASRYGAYYQLDYSFLPFSVSVFKFGFNVGGQLGLVYSDVTKHNVDTLLSPFISAQATWKNLDLMLGWKGTAYLMQAVGKDKDGFDFDNWWANSFRISVRYRFGSSSGQSSNSTARSGNESNSKSNTKIISGSNTTIRRTF